MSRFRCPVEGCKRIINGRGKDLYTPPYAHCTLLAYILSEKEEIPENELNQGDGCVYPDVPEELTYSHWLKSKEANDDKRT